MKNEVIMGMSNEEYHERSEVSASMIKTVVNKTPLHLKAPPKPETPAMKIGTMVHAAILEPELFYRDYAIFDGDRRTKAGKEEWSNIQHNGLIPVTPAEFEMAERMNESVRKLEDVQEILEDFGCVFEPSCFYQDPTTGMACRFRPDAWHKEADVILDVKTCQDASPGAFAKDIAKFGYHIQAAHYCEGVAQITGVWPKFIFLAVEKEAPYAAAQYELDELTLSEGQSARMMGLRAIQQAREDDEWVGYPPNVQTLQIPRWAFKATDPFDY